MNATFSSASEASQEALIARIIQTPRHDVRRMIAIAGPPASGKSTYATTLADALTATGCTAQVVPMDGFHLDNAILTARGLLDRKGAPETFDADGFRHLMGRLATGAEIAIPVFDRTRDIAIAGAEIVPKTCDTVIVEGNYLLLDAPIWTDLTTYWDCSIRLDVPLPELTRRLVSRWRDHGLTQEQAVTRAEQNDLRNAKLITSTSRTADVVVSTDTATG